jgi:hypothetical protein
MLLLVAGLFALAALVLLGVSLATRTADRPQPTATVQLVTVAAPAFTPASAPTSMNAPTAISEPTATLPPPPSAGAIKIGDFVQITGTGTVGFLNLREEPSLSAAVNYLALEREVLQVQAGPSDADGITWWYLVDPATNTRFGWGAQNYLQVVQGP